MYLYAKDKKKKASVVISCIDKDTSCYFWKKCGEKPMIRLIKGEPSDNQQCSYSNCLSNYQRKRKSKKGKRVVLVENCKGFCKVGGGREEEEEDLL